MLEAILQVILFAGLMSNLIALWVILRQNLRKLDIGFALVMAACDLIFVAYKIGEAVYIGVSGDMRPKENVNFGQWHGLMTTLLLHVSTVCVGYLAALRFWVIVKRRKPNVKVWWTMFVVPQVLLLVWLIAAAAQGNFVILRTRALFFLDIRPRTWVVKICRLHIALADIFVIIAVNVSYPWIAQIYVANLRTLHSGKVLWNQTVSVYIKIISHVILYDLIMSPIFIFLALEILTEKVATITLESITVVTIFSVTIVNPLVLLTLHHETQCEFQELVSHFKMKLTPKNSQVLH